MYHHENWLKAKNHNNRFQSRDLLSKQYVWQSYFYVNISIYQETFIEPQEPYFACIVFWVQSMFILIFQSTKKYLLKLTSDGYLWQRACFYCSLLSKQYNVWQSYFYVSISVYQETLIKPQEPYFACIVLWVQSYVYGNISIYQEIFIEPLMVICGKELVSIVHWESEL